GSVLAQQQVTMAATGNIVVNAAIDIQTVNSNSLLQLTSTTGSVQIVGSVFAGTGGVAYIPSTGSNNAIQFTGVQALPWAANGVTINFVDGNTIATPTVTYRS